MEKSIITTGKTLDLAIEAALKQLGLDRDSVSVEIIENAKSGFLGFGAQPAKVKVTYEAPDEETGPAPALSSAALSILLTLRGQWHYGSVCLGGVWLGCKNRLTPWGVETERLSLPDPLYARLEEAVDGLRAIL